MSWQGTLNDEAVFKRWFIVSCDKAFNKTLEKVATAARQQVKDWKRRLQEALGWQLSATKTKNPKTGRLSKRPSAWSRLRQPRTAEFPRRNTGALQKSIDVLVTSHKTRDLRGTVSIKARVGNPDKHYAVYTNKGLRAPKTATPGSWIGWLDDVIYGSGRGQVPSISNIFKKIKSGVHK